GAGGAGVGQRLALALRQARAVARHHGVVAVRQPADEAVRVRALGRGDALLVRRVQPAVADVLHDRAGEQVRVLQHRAERAPQVVLADVAHVDAVVGYHAGVDLVETVYKVRDGRLARAGGADEDRKSTRLNSSHVSIS